MRELFNHPAIPLLERFLHLARPQRTWLERLAKIGRGFGCGLGLRGLDLDFGRGVGRRLVEARGDRAVPAMIDGGEVGKPLSSDRIELIGPKPPSPVADGATW